MVHSYGFYGPKYIFYKCDRDDVGAKLMSRIINKAYKKSRTIIKHNKKLFNALLKENIDSIIKNYN